MLLGLSPVRAADDPAEHFRDQLARQRIQYARLKMELARTLDQLQDLNEFLLARRIEQTLEQWRAQRRAMIEQRARIAEQRRELERQLAEKNAKLADLPSDKPAVAPKSPPQWVIEYKIAVVPLDKKVDYLYVEPTRGDWLVDLFPRIDRHSIMVRGTIQNRSAEPYRAAFTVLLSDPLANPIGSRRYQTPLLGADDPHIFEIRVPVRDVVAIERYRITEIESDQPPAPDRPQ